MSNIKTYQLQCKITDNKKRMKELSDTPVDKENMPERQSQQNILKL